MAFTIRVSADSPFTLDNIPFGVISTESDPKPRCATALGDYAIDLAAYWKERTYTQLEGSRSLYDIFNQVFDTPYPEIMLWQDADSSLGLTE
jgi:fumarylacetoacetase